MAMGDRFWRLAIVFWSASALALVLGMASGPMLRALGSDSSIASSSIATAAKSSPPVKTSAGSSNLRREETAFPPKARSHAQTARSRVTPQPKAPPTNAVGAPTTDHPTMRVAAAAAPDQSSDPPHRAMITPLTEASAPAARVERAQQISDRIASGQKWLADETGLNVHALLNLGTNYNFNQPATGNNTYRVFDYFGAGGFEPNQAELYLNRSVPNQPGFVVDLNFLNTAEVMHGLTSYYGNQPGAHNPTGWMDPTQVYLTYTLPVGKGLSLSAGRQVSLIGYEYIPSWNNINFNQSIDLMYSLGEPFTVTGVRGTYPLGEHLSATLGLNNGWDVIATNNLFPDP